MRLNAKLDTTLWGLICVVAAVTVPVIVATWTIARLLQSDELTSYRKAEEWGVKDAISKIETLSERAALNAEERTELLGLRKQTESDKRSIEQLTSAHKKEVDSLNAAHRSELNAVKIEIGQKVSELEQQHSAETKNLHATIQSLTTERTELKSALEAIVENIESIEVPEGEARFLVPNTLAVGVESAYGSFATISVGDRSNSSVKAGNKIDLALGEKKYVLTVMKITDNSCTFAFNEAPAGKH